MWSNIIDVGDNVGDVAGMGADLFESFVGSLIACIQLSEDAAFCTFGRTEMVDGTKVCYPDEYDTKQFLALPFWVSGFGILSSMIGIFLVRTSQESTGLTNEAIQSMLLSTLHRGINFATFLSLILSFLSCGMMFGFDKGIAYEIFGCIAIGLACGEFIGWFTGLFVCLCMCVFDKSFLMFFMYTRGYLWCVGTRGVF